MPQCIRTLKVKLRPNATQAKQLSYQCSLVRHVYNWGLNRRIEHYKETCKGLTYNQQSAEMTAYKRVNNWLYDCPANSLQHSLKDVERAFKNFFERRAKFPKFKSRHHAKPSMRHPNGCELKGKMIKLPKLGWLRCFNSWGDDFKLKAVTVKQDTKGDWYATCQVAFEAQPNKEIKSAIGIDLGLINFAVYTDGQVYEHEAAPKFFREFEPKLAKAQKALSRKRKGSKNRAKAKLKVSKLHKRIANLRSNFLHQLSSKLTKEYDLICTEDLSLKGMKQALTLGKSVSDAALGEFLMQVEYKTLWRGKTHHKIDRFFPSSKLHIACGAVNKSLGLQSKSTFVCECGDTVNRDKNAALNILIEGASGYDIPTLKLWSWSKRLAMLNHPTVKQKSPCL